MINVSVRLGQFGRIAVQYSNCWRTEQVVNWITWIPVITLSSHAHATQLILVLDSCVWLHLYISYINVCEFYTRRPWAKFAPNYLHDVRERRARGVQCAYVCIEYGECICGIYTATFYYIFCLCCCGLKWFNGSGESTARTHTMRDMDLGKLSFAWLWPDGRVKRWFVCGVISNGWLFAISHVSI